MIQKEGQGAAFSERKNDTKYLHVLNTQNLHEDQRSAMYHNTKLNSKLCDGRYTMRALDMVRILRPFGNDWKSTASNNKQPNQIEGTCVGIEHKVRDIER